MTSLSSSFLVVGTEDLRFLGYNLRILAKMKNEMMFRRLRRPFVRPFVDTFDARYGPFFSSSSTDGRRLKSSAAFGGLTSPGTEVYLTLISRRVFCEMTLTLLMSMRSK